MDTSALVSIIIPVYNTGKYLINCLESCLNQTYTNLEIVLVDDCSTDQYTKDLLAQYAAKDSRILLIRSPQNNGLAQTRNIGVDACQGKYFTFIDSDDRFWLNYVERNMEVMLQHDVDLVFTKLHNYVEAEKTKELELALQLKSPKNPFAPNQVTFFADIASQGLLLDFPVNACCKFFNTERYRQAGLKFNPEWRIAEDNQWWNHLLFAFKTFYYLPIPGIMRLLHTNSLSAAGNQANKLRKYIDVYVETYDICKEHGVLKQHKDYLSSVVLSYLLNVMLEIEDLEDRYQALSELLPKYEYVNDLEVSRFPAKFQSYLRLWHIIYENVFHGQKYINVLCFALPCLFDDTNSSMTLVQHWLDGIADIGCQTLVSFTNLSQHKAGHEMLNGILANLFRDAPTALVTTKILNASILSFPYYFYDNVVLTLKDKQLDNLTKEDQVLIELFALNLAQRAVQNKTDVVLVTGTDPCSLKVFALLKQLKFKLVYVATGCEDGFKDGAPLPAPIYATPELLQGSFTVPTTQQEVMALFDSFVTFSAGIAEAWRQSFKQPIQNLGYLQRRNYKQELTKQRLCVAIPSIKPQNGLAIVLKLIMAINQQMPQLGFLIIQDKGVDIGHEFSLMHFPDGTLLAQCSSGIQNITMIQPPLCLDQVYDLSQVVLLPTLTQYALAEPIVNALVNGVPVITTDVGEKPELTIAPSLQQDVVTYVPVPASTLADPYCLPTDQEIEPFVAAVKRLLEQDHAAIRRKALDAYDVSLVQKAWRDFLATYSKG